MGGHPSQDEASFDRSPSELRNLESTNAETLFCKFKGCSRLPKYGPKHGPATLCKDHKKAGMFTTRNGELLMSTQDGRLRHNTEKEASAPTAAPVANATTTAPEADDGTGDHSPPPSSVGVLPAPGGKPHGASVNSKKTGKVIQKRCQVPGCKKKASAGSLRGKKRPSFCNDHKEAGMSALSDIPCLYPGCDTRPGYGIHGGRPVYCTIHKKAGMVHIRKTNSNKTAEEENLSECGTTNCTSVGVTKKSLGEKKEACSKEKNRSPEEGGHGAAADDVPKGTAPRTKIPGAPVVEVKKTVAKGASKSHKKQNQRENASPKRGSKKQRKPTKVKVSAPSIVGDGDRKAQSPTKKGTKKRKSPETPSSPSSPSTPPGKRGQTSPGPTQPAQSHRQRLADMSGAAPSAEMRILQEARESARAAAAANGAGRRARVPSIKALQAAGLAEVEGAQWMSQEKHQEEARRLREYKEAARQFREYKKQLKAEAAAQLASGQHGSGAVPVIGGSGGDGDGDVASGIGVEIGGNKAPQETGPELTAHQSGIPNDSIITAKNNEEDLCGGGNPSKRSMPSGSEKASDGVSESKRVRSAEVGDVEGCSNTMSAPPIVEATGNGGGEQQNSSQTRCNFEACAEVACYGVHGIARYCGRHRLFGMRKVSD